MAILFYDEDFGSSRPLVTVVVSPHGAARFDQWGKEHPPMPGERYVLYMGLFSISGLPRDTLAVCIDELPSAEVLDNLQACGMSALHWPDDHRVLTRRDLLTDPIFAAETFTDRGHSLVESYAKMKDAANKAAFSISDLYELMNQLGWDPAKEAVPDPDSIVGKTVTLDVGYKP